MRHRTYREQIFHMDGSAAMRLMILSLLAMIGLNFLIDRYVIGTPLLSTGDLIAAAVLYLLLCVVAVEYMKRRFRTRISPDGVETFNMFGRNRRVGWASITGAHKLTIVGVSSAHFRSTDAWGRLCLPVNVDRDPAFCDLVDRYTESGHPLRSILAPSRR